MVISGGSSGKEAPQRKASEILREYFEENGWLDCAETGVINLRGIYETVVYPRIEFGLVTDVDLGKSGNQHILGKTIPKEKVILIDRSIAPPERDPRYPFTLAHEFGHALLHEKPLCRTCTEEALYRAGGTDSFEFEANVFAEHLLMPDGFVRFHFASSYGMGKPLRYIGSGEYFFTAWGVSRKYWIASYTDFCRMAAGPMTFYFSNVSKEALGLKLHKLGLIVNCTDEAFVPSSEPRVFPRMSIAI